MSFEEFEQSIHLTLNDQQKTAVQAVEGPVLLLAVPGSGKTTVLVARLGYMVRECGIAPENILTLTYTVSATKDMAARYERFFGRSEAGRLQFRTINGISASIVYRFGRAIGKTPFRLLSDEKEAAGILSRIYREKAGGYATESDLHILSSSVSYIKNSRLEDWQIQRLGEQQDLPLLEIYNEYQLQLRRNRLMDYDDQMVHALAILEKYPQVLSAYQDQYRYLCVDEAQDTSRIQHDIIRLLASRDENLFMFGDEDQSIYGFRAAAPDALLSFEEDHPGAKVLLMEENYRSTSPIVEAADRFIQSNKLRHPKHMSAVRNGGVEIRFADLGSRHAQYAYLLSVAKACTEQTAILFRDNECMLPLIDLFEREGIPFRTRGTDSTFFTHRTITDLRNILAFADNPSDGELFLQLYYKFGTFLSKAQAMEAVREAGRRDMPVIDACLLAGRISPLVRKNLQTLKSNLACLKNDTAETGINRILYQMHYSDHLEQSGIGDGKMILLRYMGYREDSLYSLFARLDYLHQWLEERENPGSCPLILSTIHSSKGLEYTNVFLMDVIDSVFPAQLPVNLKHMTDEERKSYEEERRLFYVAVTRARERLVVLRIAKQKSLFVEQFSQCTRPAPIIRTGGTAKTSKVPPKAPAVPAAAFTADDFPVGAFVLHTRYGSGVIRKADGDTLTIEYADKPRVQKLSSMLKSGILAPASGKES